LKKSKEDNKNQKNKVVGDEKSFKENKKGKVEARRKNSDKQKAKTDEKPRAKKAPRRHLRSRANNASIIKDSHQKSFLERKRAQTKLKTAFLKSRLSIQINQNAFIDSRLQTIKMKNPSSNKELFRDRTKNDKYKHLFHGHEYNTMRVAKHKVSIFINSGKY
jgi:hypothetical protein